MGFGVKCLNCDCIHNLNKHGLCETCESRVIVRTKNFTSFKSDNELINFTSDDIDSLFDGDEND